MSKASIARMGIAERTPSAFGEPREVTANGEPSQDPVLPAPPRMLERTWPSVGGGFWVLCKRGADRMSAPAVAEASARAVAVFSSRREAGEFFRHRSPEGKWWIRRLPAQRFSAQIQDLLGGYTSVALDPPPEIEDRAVADLVSISREEFVELLVRQTLPRLHGRSETDRSRAIPGGG